MIDPSLPDADKVMLQTKIIDALVNRIERGNDLQGSQFAIFQSAIALQYEVQSKSERLEEALSTLGSTVDELQTVYHDHERVRNNLSDALEVMEEGFALFSEGRLVVCNEHFRKLLPDIAATIEIGMSFEDYIRKLTASRFVNKTVRDIAKWSNLGRKIRHQPYYSLVAPLANDRWHQIAFRRASFGSIAILQTDITATVKQNLREKDRLIDQYTRFLQGTFDHLVLGVASFSADWRLQLHNKMFADLLFLPTNLLTTEMPIERMFEFLNHKILSPATPLHFDKEQAVPLHGRMGEPITLRRQDGAILDAHFHEHPEGGFIVNIRDITLQARAIEALHRSNETLEEHVRVRTSELRDANERLKAQNSELARTEEELRHAKEAAEQANASKTRFLAAASHDLLQPVSAAKLYISMLKDGVAASQRDEYVKRLDRAFHNVESLLHDLLDISRLESGSTRLNIGVIDLHSFLNDMVENFAELARSKSIRLSIRNLSSHVRSDEHYLGRILQNLVVNAIQYTPVGGRVLIAARPRQNLVAIEVWDTGIGIEAENLQRIFDEFTRLDPGNSPGSGMGLGLSIVEHACRHLDHPLSVYSKPGRGSLFRIEVPVTAPLPQLHSQSRSGMTPSHENFSCLIFLVENDPEVLFATASLLENWGASVIAVTSTAKAIEQFHELGETPHLVIVDYQLDHEDNGIEAIKSLREVAGSSLPAIVVTANHSEALEKSGELLDFTVLKKPIHPHQLKKLISEKADLAIAE